MPPQARKPGRKARARLLGRWLPSYTDWTTYVGCTVLIAMIVWLASTRPPIPFSFTGASHLLRCELAPLSTVSGEGEPVEYPHFHVPSDALIAISTALRLATDDQERATGGSDSVPQSPQATAVINFGRRYTVQLYMHRAYVITLMPGNAVPIAHEKAWSSLRLPDRYTIAFLFHYPPDAVMWKVVGTEDLEFTLRTSGFDRDQILTKPTGERLDIYGIPYSFHSTPAALEWPPLMGQLLRVGPNGLVADYESMLLATVESDSNTDLIEASPLMCEKASLGGAVGELSSSVSGQPLRGPVDLRVIGAVEVRATHENQRISYMVTGLASSVTVGGRELVPTRLDAIGPFWAGLLSTVTAAFILALIARKGGMIRQWRRK
jgi:hypothetical protein